MSTQPPSRRPAGEIAITYDYGDRRVFHFVADGTPIVLNGDPIEPAHADDAPAPGVPFTFLHDTQRRVFILKWADGKTEVFRDNPARHLCVEPDPRTGEIRPVTNRGEPVYLFLCREERER